MNPTDLEQYEAQLACLRTACDSDTRAGHLESMAGWADVLALTASCMHDDEHAAAKWTSIAVLCRAVAATERGFVLSDPHGGEVWLDGNREAWTALARASRYGGNVELERAGILHGLYEAISPVMPSGAALVLDDIAATEMAVAESAVAS